ncbi:MAG TPA: PKD domain-containing protein [Gemmataceae bacterium]|nr:PKD domain-containing protein [Gemmataceae bacterium]
MRIIQAGPVRKKFNSAWMKGHLQLEALEDRRLLSGGNLIGGPDGYGYSAYTANFQNINLQPGQPGVFTILQGADDAYAAVNLGSDKFNFYGQTYTGANSLFVSSKGLITLGAGDLAYQNTDLTAGPALPTIAPLWTDLFNNKLPGNAPEIMGQFQQLNGSGVDNQLVIEWNQVGAWRDYYSPPITFEAILQLNTGFNTSSITFNYSTLNATTSPIVTTGIKAGGTQGADRILISENAASPYIASGQAIQFTAPPFGSTISGQVFDDLNNNGVQNPGEPGMAGVTVYLDLNRDGHLDPGDPSTVTDSNGNYSFTDLTAGSYLVEEVTPQGFSRTLPSGSFTTPAVGPDGFGYGASATTIQNINLQPNQPGVFTIAPQGADVSVPVDLGSSTFNLYGTSYTGPTSLYVSSNGLITMGVSDIGLANGDLTTFPTEPAIAPYWFDWYNYSSFPMVLGKFVDNAAGTPTELILEWNNVNSPNTLTFQAILQLNTGADPANIEFDYPSLTSGNPLVDNGADASVGIEYTLMGASDRLLVSENSSTNPLVGTGKAMVISTANGGAYGVALGFRSTATGNNFGNFEALTAVNDAYSLNENQTLTVQAPGVLANDSGAAPGAPLSAVLVSSASHGTLKFNSDGSFTYTPSPQYVGADSFTYMATNGGSDSNVATVSLTVNAVADPPILTVAPASGLEDSPTPLSISASPSDTNVQETVSVQISSVPTGVTLSAGINEGGGVWELTQAQLQGLTLLSPAPATFTLAVTATATVVSDGSQASTNATLNVVVSNVAPANLKLSLSAPIINENSSTSLSGTFTDPGPLDTHTVVINWGDGNSSTVQLTAGVVSFSGVSHQYLESPPGQPTGSYSIQVTVTDNYGGSTTATTSVQVDNVPPSNLKLTLSTTTINEGSSTSLSGTFVDPGTLDTNTVAINWGDGGTSTVNLAAGVLTFSGVTHQYVTTPGAAASGSYTISVTVTDQDGASTSANTSVTVNSVAPSNLQLALSASTINEGSSTNLSGSFADPATHDTRTVAINWGDGGTSTVNLAAGVLTFSGVSHQYVTTPGAAASGSYTISVIVTDQDGGSTIANTSVTVNSVAPSNLQLALSASTINEGSSTSLSGSFADPAVLDTRTVAINWGDGGTSTVNLAAGVLTFSGVTHQYVTTPGAAASGSYTVSVTVTDQDGGSTSANTSVTVNSVAPSNLQLALSASTINEGSSTSLSGSFADPATLDTRTVAINWGDGGTSTVNLAAGVTTFSGISHQYLDNPPGAPTGSFTISVTVTDQDGGSTNAQISVQVNNVPPSNLSLTLSATSINVGSSTSLGGSFVDPGTLDTHTVAINWGDGGTSTVNLAAGVLTFSGVTHQYVTTPGAAASGSYTISVTVTDKDGGSTSAQISEQVNNVPPSNLSLTLSPTSINVGSSTSLGGTFVDPDTLDTHTVAIKWGDGGTSTVSLAAGVLTFSGVTHQYLATPGGAASGSYTISVTVTDNDQASVSGSISVQVTGSAVQVGISDPAGAVRGQDLTFQLSATDSSASNQAGTFTYVIHWSADSVQTVTGPSSLTVDHIFTQTGTYNVSVTATDQSGATSAPVAESVAISAIALEADPLYQGKMALVVGGSTGNDQIFFTPACKRGQIEVTMDGKDLGSYAPTSRIIAFGQAGNDIIEVSSRITMPAWLYAGSGNALLVAGGGNDILVGGSGNDMLVAGHGRDILIGGTGNNVLVGRGRGDLLVGGSTVYDHSQVALFAIQQEWTSSHSYETRIANLSGTGKGKSFAERLNGNYFLTVTGQAPTVIPDKNCEVILARPCVDWNVTWAQVGDKHSHHNHHGHFCGDQDGRWYAALNCTILRDLGDCHDSQQDLTGLWNKLASDSFDHWLDDLQPCHH